jgi:RimJ/RimL family protein N-acetyltransferase
MTAEPESTPTTPRLDLVPVSLDLARVLAGPDDADEPVPPSWAEGYPLPGTRRAAHMFVLGAEAGRAGGPRHWGMFRIVLRENGQTIGDIGFHGPPSSDGTVEIGYGLVGQYRGRGLAGEAAVALCALTWTRPEVTRIIAHTDETNAASAGVLRHAGFRDDGAADGFRNFSLARPAPEPASSARLSWPMITCVVEYVIDPAQTTAFERFAQRWMELVNRHGGTHHGYFLPAEGASDKALALFSFPSLAAYEQYRQLFGRDPDFIAADRIRDESHCVLRYERTFMRPLLPG